MKPLIIVLAVSAMLVSRHAVAEDLKQGLNALNRGDYAKAVVELRPLADKGDPTAQYSLGLMYERGDGVQQDYDQALCWLQKSAEQGAISAWNELGVMYAHGKGLPKDYDKANEWFYKGVRAGDAQSQFNLGFSFAHGYGVPRDPKQAIRLYEAAANQGYAPAEAELGFAYMTGHAIERNLQFAVTWNMKSAAQGNAYGYFNLGYLFASGQGVTQDLVAAYALFDLCDKSFASNPEEDAALATNRSKAIALMSTSQIDEGKRLSEQMRKIGVVEALKRHSLRHSNDKDVAKHGAGEARK